MDRVVKIIWAVSVAMMVFVACNKGGGGAQVNGPRNRNGNNNKNQPGANASGDTREALSEDKMTPEQKASAVEIKLLRVLFRDAASLYGEAWKAIVKDNPTQSAKKENVGNMLKLISEILEDNFNVHGAPYTNKYIEKNKKGETIATVYCKGPGESQVRQVSGSKSTYEILFTPCSKNASKDTENVQGWGGNLKKIATINKNSKGDRNFSVTWNIADLDESPDQMMGLLVNSPNKKKEDGQDKLTSGGCDFEAFVQGHLAAMNCQNLAQDISKNEYAVVTSFDFRHPKFEKREHPVTMDFKEYAIKDDNTEEERPGRVIDNPVNGELWVKMEETTPKEFQTDISKPTPAMEAAKKAEQERLQKEQKERELQNGVNADQGGARPQQAAAGPSTGVSAGVQQPPSDPQQQNQDGSLAPSGAQPSQDVGPSTSRGDASPSAT